MSCIMQGLHYVPGGHVCPKRSASWDFCPFRSCYAFQARTQHEADEAVASSVFSYFLFFITENSQKFWVFRNFGSATGPRLVWFPTLATGLLSNCLWRYAGQAVTGCRWLTPGGSKARYGSARSAPNLLRMPVHCLPGRHGLMGFLAFIKFLSKTETSFTFSQVSLWMKRGHRTALVCVWTYLAS